ncbi:MAG: response regulator transcription factor [Planctomycetaceae bacterium]|nr:response regulator transcription factor [Planctomycetaceae bacterium]
MKTQLKTTFRILIVDDHPTMCDGLCARITNEADMTVCGQADDVDPALELVRDLAPDIVLIDISLKTGHGIDLVKQIRQRYPGTKMLVNSMYEESVYAERALQAGAMGYLNKQTAGDTLIKAIRTVLAGKTYVSPEMTDRILHSRVGGMIQPGSSPVECLSDRELEVLTLIGHGKTTSAIAEQLFLSVHTIDTYREKLKIKLNLANSAELNRYAVQWVLENG